MNPPRNRSTDTVCRFFATAVPMLNRQNARHPKTYTGVRPTDGRFDKGDNCTGHEYSMLGREKKGYMATYDKRTNAVCNDEQRQAQCPLSCGTVEFLLDILHTWCKYCRS